MVLGFVNGIVTKTFCWLISLLPKSVWCKRWTRLHIQSWYAECRVGESGWKEGVERGGGEGKRERVGKRKNGLKG